MLQASGKNLQEALDWNVCHKRICPDSGEGKGYVGRSAVLVAGAGTVANRQRGGGRVGGVR